MKWYNRLGLLVMTASLSALIACKSQESSSVIAVATAVAAPAAQPSTKAHTTHVVFVGKEQACE